MGQALTLSDPLRVILHRGALPVAWQGQLHGDMGLECASFYAHVPHGPGCPAALNNSNPFTLSFYAYVPHGAGCPAALNNSNPFMLSFYAHVPHGAGCPAALNHNNPFTLSFYAHVPHGAGCPVALNNKNPFALSLSKRCAPRQRLCTPGARPLSRTRVGRRHALAHEKH